MIEVLSSSTLVDIQAEATNAHQSYGDQSMMGHTMIDGDRLAILTEEIGEVAKVLNEIRIKRINNDESLSLLYRELQQVAAMAATWMEVITQEILDQ